VNVGAGIGKATTTLVQKKYGEEAAEASENAQGIVGGAVQINYAIK
jgi:hypothetical protein